MPLERDPTKNNRYNMIFIGLKISAFNCLENPTSPTQTNNPILKTKKCQNHVKKSSRKNARKIFPFIRAKSKIK